MKGTILAASLAAFLALPLTASAATEYGQPMTVKEIAKVSEILDNPEQYVGREVKVEGMIVAVCARRGCWMEIAGDRRHEKIRIKVDDGVIVFPLSARGKRALVQGKLETIDLGVEEARKFFAHQAEEKGMSFDPSTVTGPMKLYQVRATGAVID
jgi:hypothetical protein